jgi:RIO kinase 1
MVGADETDPFLSTEHETDLDPAIESRIDDRLRSKTMRWRPPDGFKGRKTVNEVLDKSTMMTLYKMISAGTVSGIEGAVGAGKESLLFRGVREGETDLALKVYLVSTSNFKKRADYIRGDPRFSRFRKNTRDLVYLWARKEFRNLHQSFEAGVRVPRPVKVANNVLAMEFVGEVGRPAPLLLHSHADGGDYQQILDMMGTLYTKAGLVHGDCSEYNIFKHGKRLVLFDLGSAVDRRHPAAGAFLRRDINNINRFFGRRGVAVRDLNDILGDME